jgi:diketogulonate reductase-like aldo/keto reductase
MSKQVAIPTVELTSGFSFPVIGLGTYKTNGEPEKLFSAVKAAIEYGYRHFDCALCYENEEIIGKAIRSAIDESKGALKREDFFIVTKLWNTYHSAEEVPRNVDIQLKSFGIEYFGMS